MTWNRASIISLCAVWIVSVLAPPPAYALKCKDRRYTQLVPRTRTQAVSPRARVMFLSQGVNSYARERGRLKHYRLVREGRSQGAVPVQVVQRGNLVLIGPKAGRLATNTWYRLEYSGKGSGHPTTRFKTASHEKRLPAPGHIRIVGVTEKPRSRHRARSISVELTAPRISLGAAGLFHWELQIRSGKKWKTIQGAPLRWFTPFSSPKASIVRSIKVGVDAGASMCRKLPWIKGKQRVDLRVALVRGDGKRWTTPTRTVTLN